MSRPAPQRPPETRTALRDLQTGSAKAASGGHRRFTALFLRSRRAGHAAALLAGLGVIFCAGMRLVAGPPDGLPVSGSALILPPLGAACILGAATASPFGDAEGTAARSLPLVRVLHLASLLLVGAAVIVSAAVPWEVEPAAWALARNLAGLAGIALISGRVLGAGLSWGPTLLYGIVALLWGLSFEPKWWNWPAHPADGVYAGITAGVLLGVGLAVASVLREKDATKEGE